MNVALNAGFASKYFVTDAERGVACAADPALFIAARTVDVEQVAAFFGFLAAGATWQASDHAKRAAAALRAVVDADFSAADALAGDRPLVILAEGFADKLLPALKIIKLRGLRPVLAVAVPDGRQQLATGVAALAATGAAGSAVFVADDRLAAGVPVARGVTVVSGLNQTVLSAGLSAEQIIAAHPAMCSGPVDAVDEPLI
ncbi:MAG: hypothetical protein JXB04_01345 [Kiritimatiellae bacterium]|nr:hypothetical protein [Kiritimatiellia bacterium]